MNILYILMRTDLPSMNAGKAMAQASHASNAFTFKQIETCNPHANEAAMEWTNETTQGFGTVLVLGVNESELRLAISQAEYSGLPAELIVDPSYPYKVTGEVARLISSDEIYEGNKEYTLYRKEITCGYIFGEKDDANLKGIVGSLKLHQ